jgi:hypothetical protein
VRFGMQRSDRSLQLIGSGPTHPQRLLDQRQPLTDLRAIPQGSVLLF